VHRCDALTIDEVDALDPDGVLVSPGPGRPADAGISNEVIRAFGGLGPSGRLSERHAPVLGVCLGHQCIGEVFGGEVVRAPQVMHGKTSLIRHHDVGVFEGLPNPLEATRYHSLVVDRASVPDVLEITAETDDGLVMGLRHREHDIEGVQFHPESILTVAGHDLLRTFLARADRVAAR
jgi:anthranilate synthase/aminodeoxychorismate synthase-like glutamine amidotransferase